MKILIIKGTSPLGLAYSVGDEATLPEAQARELIELGYATLAEEIKQAVVEETEGLKKAVKKR